MTSRTALFDAHQAAGGRMVTFAGWELPIHYGSQIDEHHAVRQRSGLFDVSHMTVVDIQGTDARSYLRHLLANDVGRLQSPGQALYGCMLNESGGIVDDLITYYLHDDFYRTVVNAATRETDLAWMRSRSEGFDVRIIERDDLAMLAAQGPAAREQVAEVLGLPQCLELKPFHSMAHDAWFVARTGYTGEDGFEILLPATLAPELWQQLLAAGMQPCGLGARDSLRMEAGLNLYGQDMDTETSPLESNLGWTVALEPEDRQFVGRQAVEELKQTGVERRLVGLVLAPGAIPRSGAEVDTASGPGAVTSGGFGPTVERPIALARIPAGEVSEVSIRLRGRDLSARVVRPPFVRGGKIRDSILD